jgi:HPt (histidine-containing phosphotransfer) domain-containing protein
MSSRKYEPDPKVLDIVHLRRYTQGNADFERELLGLFAAQVPSLLTEIRQTANIADWKLAVHTLKGSARAVGAVAVGHAAIRLEESGYSASEKTRARLLQRLEMALADFAREAKKLTA